MERTKVAVAAAMVAATAAAAHSTPDLHQGEGWHIDEVDQGPGPPSTCRLGVGRLEVVQHHRVHVDAQVVFNGVTQGTDQLQHHGARAPRVEGEEEGCGV
jgi:hypothetical protein